MSKSVSKCVGLCTHLMIQVLQFLEEVMILYPNSAPKTVFIYLVKDKYALKAQHTEIKLYLFNNIIKFLCL